MKLEHLFENRIQDFTIDKIKNNIHTLKDLTPESIDFSEYEVAFNRIKKHIKGGKLKVFRGIATVVDVKEFLSKVNSIGTSWTYDITSANVYRDFHRGHGNKYIMIGEVKEDDVDWIQTLALNMIPVRGRYEMEIRMKKNSKIILSRIIDEDHNDISMSGIKKQFKS